MSAVTAPIEATVTLACDASDGLAPCEETFASTETSIRAARAAAAADDWTTGMMPNLISGKHLVDLCPWHRHW
ncbi:hypothetical protein GCM10025867_51580 (plasmid) [Frondihabitans sucicola]|uniref:Uncharacterized protein n=1 Tax=Frondihabitans sucicola TaxID=1268041 RepID=A0ABM8GVE8_9MICO|nr:hypothetical protein [Frondihabitans sucicola]BDZ52350.1 hypothetical protein GCM10025867_45910 [Frondihabitans sucicola]BDZ52917.1 hypothetical protein GCM10025867_51580 [Frondihabitans sucicola]